jgi:basic amino acid/polyamine antiporter, APA family
MTRSTKPATRFPAALSRIGIHWGGALVATGAIVGMVSTLLVTAYGQVRIFMAMSRDGLLPQVFCRIHARHKTPHVVTWLTGILTAILSGFLPLPALMELVNIGTLFAFVLVSIGVIVLRYTHPNFERKFRVPGAPFTPALTIAFSIYLMAYLPTVTWLRFFIWIGIGFLIYFLYSTKHSLVQRGITEKSGPPGPRI